ncbi:UbiA family prenyltransferase [Aquiluna sp. KACHI24]|uniref:UbiA family prenyltransferase n=1 Tax=Aquiluna sp. KACHI24 TaxID=2968831 RepID=UPI0021FF9F4D|nr:UbiA family prenyltransferase [Aquiluna sp. KACHI24]BDP99744.1 prenyltransferase [Aquiluna sp. KACHI24]
MLRRLIEISRPVLWINTIGTTVVGMWLAGYLWDWRVLPILIWVTFPFNLLIYGINDIFDQETDNINARKGGYEGAHIFPNEVRPIWITTVLTNVPFLIYFAITLPWQATAWMVAYSLFFTFYSAPPLRFKARKYLDALSNTDYAFPLAFLPLALGVEPNWWLVIGLMAWSVAKHAYDAIQDIPQDSDTGIVTTAVHLGVKKTAIWSTIWWAISIALFAVVNIPVAIANAIIAYLLVAPLYKEPTPEKAHSLYKYSIAFPYVAGAVGGFQLVVGLVFGLYP